MRTGRVISAVFLTCMFASSAQAQDAVSPCTPASNPILIHRPVAAVNASTNETIPLTVPTGTAVQVVLDKEIRIQKVGQSVHGRVAEPVYAFDKLVVPVGTEVTGRITQLESVSGGRRTLDALNADFTPPRKVQIEFDDLELIGGRHIPIHTSVTPGSGQVIQFVTSADDEKEKGVKDAASEKADQAKEEAKQQWDNAMSQVHEPGKIRRITRYAVAQLPVHPQYIDAGTVYFAELEEPLDFGTEPLTPEIAASINAAPLPGSSVHVWLMTGLSSATAQKGDHVEAVLSQPLFDGNRLVLPQGSRLKGSVVQVRPARRLSRNGQLRMVFHELVLPDGVEQKVEASLEGVQSGKDANVKLDSEGGAEATTPKTRYLATAVALTLAAASTSGGDTDVDNGMGHVKANTGAQVAGGVSGFKVVGMVLGLAVHSRALGYTMGAYGAGVSVYLHFIARGRDLVFPKNTAMEIAIGTRASAPSPSSPKPADAKVEN
jgi:hypothetical protein